MSKKKKKVAKVTKKEENVKTKVDVTDVGTNTYDTIDSHLGESIEKTTKNTLDEKMLDRIKSHPKEAEELIVELNEDRLKYMGFMALRMTNPKFNVQVWHPKTTNFYHWIVDFFAELESLTDNNETISKEELKELQKKYNIIIQKK